MLFLPSPHTRTHSERKLLRSLSQSEFEHRSARAGRINLDKHAFIAAFFADSFGKFIGSVDEMFVSVALLILIQSKCFVPSDLLKVS